MPLYFPNNGPASRTGKRSNTHLIAGNHDTPNTQLLLDTSLPVLFDYPFGGPGQKKVVISKGMALALTGDVGRDYETNRMLPIVTIADSAVGAHRPIGLAPFNFAEQVDDRLTGNKPVVINDKYVELPYIPDLTDAEDVKWGAVVGEGLKPGDWVKPASGANKGQLTKWNENKVVTEVVPDFTSEADGTFIAYAKNPILPGSTATVSVEGAEATVLNAVQITLSDLGSSEAYSGITITYTSSLSDPVFLALGQVLEAELDQEPWGWLKWAMWDEFALAEDMDPKRPAPGMEGYEFDADYRKGNANTPGYWHHTTDPTGILGLTDGGNKQEKQWVESIVVSEGTEEDTIVQKQLNYKNLVPGSVEVYFNIGGTMVAYDGEINVDSKNGRVNVIVDAGLETAATSGDVAGEIKYKAYFRGTPTGWDFTGAVGAIRLLLQR